MKVSGRLGCYKIRTTTAHRLKLGDIIQFEGIVAYGWINDFFLHERLQTTRQFVVTNSPYGLSRILSIYPGMVSRGKYRTISRLPRKGDNVICVSRLERKIEPAGRAS